MGTDGQHVPAVKVCSRALLTEGAAAHNPTNAPAYENLGNNRLNKPLQELSDYQCQSRQATSWLAVYSEREPGLLLLGVPK